MQGACGKKACKVGKKTSVTKDKKKYKNKKRKSIFEYIALNILRGKKIGMDYQRKNKKALHKHFKDGIKKKGSGKLGVELEHFIVKKDSGDSVTFYEERGVHEILKRLAPFYDEKVMSDDFLIALKRPHILISLEPAAQLEVSIGEFLDIADIEGEYLKFRREIDPVLEEFGLKMVTEGYLPKSKVRDLPLIPKGRYRMMDEYFKSTGGHGINMMRGTAATQISIDYYSEADFSAKFRLANLLSPLFLYLTDNSPVFEGGLRPAKMVRHMVWEDVDKDRSLVVPDGTKEGYGFDDYADYVLNNPAILIMDEKGDAVSTGGKKIKDIYADKKMSEGEIEHAISMFFPYVRLKRFVEIRMADSLPIEYVLSLISLIKGIFYRDLNISNLLSDLNGANEDDVSKAFLQLAKKGFKAEVYGIDAGFLYAKMFALAKRGLNENEIEYLKPLKTLFEKGLTLADIRAQEIEIEAAKREQRAADAELSLRARQARQEV